MIRLFVGTPGAGKTYGALLDAIQELVYGERLLITNLPLLLPDLNAYLADEYPGWTGDINQRIRILDEKQTKEFYLYREIVGQLEPVSHDESRNGKHPDYASKRGVGVLYVIDEAHIPFDSREWAVTGPELTYYNGQHRKLNDELIFVTQFVNLIDVRVRGFVQEFWIFNNQGLERFMTWFQKPDYFHVEVHRKPPSGPNSPPPNETHRYKLKKRIAACYDTSAGVGISGRKLPDKKRKKAIPLWWILVPLLLAAIGMVYVPRLLGKGFVAIAGGSKTEEKPKQDIQQTPRAGNVPDAPPPTVDARPLKKATSWSKRGKTVLINFDDGSTESEGTGVIGFNKDFVVMRDGRVFRVVRTPVPVHHTPQKQSVPEPEAKTSPRSVPRSDQAPEAPQAPRA